MKYDVIVAGAGPTGICSAVAAARQGAKVALIERYGLEGYGREEARKIATQSVEAVVLLTYISMRQGTT